MSTLTRIKDHFIGYEELPQPFIYLEFDDLKDDTGIKVMFMTQERPNKESACDIFVKWFPSNCGIGIITNLTTYVGYFNTQTLEYMLEISEIVALYMGHTIVMYTTNTESSSLVTALKNRGYKEIDTFKSKNTFKQNYIFTKQIQNV